MNGKDFVSLRDFTPGEIRHFIHMACQVKANPQAYSHTLQGKTLAMIFEKPSLRTRVTFDEGMEELGGHSIFLSPTEISLGKRESVHDIAKNLERMVHGIMIRTFSHEIVEEMAWHASVPVINGLTDFSHPCQAMADYLTMLEVKGRIAGLRVAYVGDGNNVSHSLMFAGALLGAHVWIATPPGFEPSLDATSWARLQCSETGGSITLTHDPEMAVSDADVVYTDVWASMGQEGETQARAAIFRPYQVNASLFGCAKDEATFLHCLPAHRGEEVTNDVIDSARSFVFQQAENRLHAQKAILFELMAERGKEEEEVALQTAAEVAVTSVRNTC
jgi:ornithine carbamoyltransferase